MIGEPSPTTERSIRSNGHGDKFRRKEVRRIPRGVAILIGTEKLETRWLRKRSQAGDWLVFRAVSRRETCLSLTGQGDSPIFADFAAKIGTVPVNRKN